MSQKSCEYSGRFEASRSTAVVNTPAVRHKYPDWILSKLAWAETIIVPKNHGYCLSTRLFSLYWTFRHSSRLPEDRRLIHKNGWHLSVATGIHIFCSSQSTNSHKITHIVLQSDCASEGGIGPAFLKLIAGITRGQLLGQILQWLINNSDYM